MNATLLTGIGFVLFAIVLLIVLISIKIEALGKLKKFCIATEAIYLSGTVLLLFVFLLVEGIPLSFALIAEILILLVFIFTFFTLFMIARTVKNMNN